MEAETVGSWAWLALAGASARMEVDASGYAHRPDGS